MTSSLSEIVAFGNSVDSLSAITGLIEADAAGLASFLNVNATDKVVTFGILPDNDRLSGLGAQVNYLGSRPQAFRQTIAAHLTTGTVPAAASDGSATGDFTTTLTDDSNAAVVWTQNSTAWNTYTGAVLTSQTKCSGALVDINTNGGKACTYGSSSDFILWNGSTDALNLAAASTPIGNLENTDDVGGTGIDLSTLFALLGAHGGFTDLTASTPNEHITVFAPDATAADALGTTKKNWLTWNKAVSQIVLKNHIISKDDKKPIWSEQLKELVEDADPAGSFEYDPIGGMTLAFPTFGTVRPKDNAVFNATISTTDVYTKNAIVHVINNFLINTAQNQIVEDAIALEGLGSPLDATNDATLLALVNASSDAIRTALASPTTYTLFAPTEAAFDALDQVTKDYLLNSDNQDILDKVLKAHVVQGAYFDADVEPASESNKSLTDLNAGTIECKLGACTVGDTSFTASSRTYTKYGIVYKIDKVIVPSDVSLPTGGAATVAASLATVIGATLLTFLF